LLSRISLGPFPHTKRKHIKHPFLQLLEQPNNLELLLFEVVERAYVLFIEGNGLSQKK